MTTNWLYKITELRRLRVWNVQRTSRIFTRNNHWSKNSYFYGASENPLKPITIGGLFDDTVRQTPDHDYLVSRHENKKYTYRAMDAEVDQLCRSLNAIGLNRGDSVAAWMPNCALYFALVIAAARLGLILVNINPDYQHEELKHSLTLAKVKCLVAPETFKTQIYPKILEQVDPDISKRPPNTQIHSRVLPLLKTVVFNTNNRLNGAYNLESFLDLGSNKNYKIPNIQPDEGCNIQFTSGTTGNPKAVLLNHFGVVNNSYFIMKRLGIIDSDILHKCCCSMPLFHVFALSVALIGPLFTKSAVYLPSTQFEPQCTVDVITKEKCTFFFGTPTLYIDIMSIFEKLSPEKQDNNLKLAIISAAPCSPELKNKFRRLFPNANLLELFGMTETTSCVFVPFFDDTNERKLSTVGQILEHLETKVVDLNGDMVPFGTPGELLIRGYLNMSGYFNDEEKTIKTIDSNGWLHTGDQFVLREDGYGYPVGRIKDIIIRNGENLFPVEIEYFLESHPSIVQAQVYGIPDERMGEEMCASIVVKEGSTTTEADIKAYCKGKIAEFKIPKHVFIEENEFPRTASGKVQKFKLREMAMQRLSN